jgi:tyrosyl-tRNA synthetase
LGNDDFGSEVNITELLANVGILSSKNEVRKAIQGNAISVNKNKVSTHEHMVSKDDLLHQKYIMIENGKKNKYMLVLG